MTRVFTICVVSSTLAVFALSANAAFAEIKVTAPKPIVPKVNVRPNPPKVKIQSNAPKTKAFEIKDFSFGVENQTTIGSATGGAGAGKIKLNELTIKKTTDTASPSSSSANGGGIFNNGTSGPSSGGANGGGIFNNGTGGPSSGGANGGGIFNNGTGGPSSGSANGGGIFNNGTGGPSSNASETSMPPGGSVMGIYSGKDSSGVPNLVKGATYCTGPGCGGPAPK